MKSFFCWILRSNLFYILGCVGAVVAVVSTLGLLGVVESANFDMLPIWYRIIFLVLTWLPAYFTAKFVANNYEDYFMGYRDWLASRVSFFETKTGFVIRTFFFSAGIYSVFAWVVVVMLKAMIDIA